MKFYIKQKVFTLWGDSFKIKDENEQDCFQVKTPFSFFKKLYIKDMNGNILLVLKKRYFRFMKRWDVCDANNNLLFYMKQKFAFMHASCKIINVDESLTGEYSLSGNVLGFNFQILKDNTQIASIGKKILSWSDTYELSVDDANEYMRTIAITLILDAIYFNNKNKHKN